MIIDTSAIVAIIKGEDDSTRLLELTLASQTSLKMSASTYVELGAVVDAVKDPVASRRLDALLQKLSIQVVPFTPEQAVLARAANRDFGTGSGSRACLNLGDTFSYALAKHLSEPLLFKGGEFSETDVEAPKPPKERIKTGQS